MSVIELLNQIFQVCIVPLLGVLTAYIIKYINTKSAELESSSDNETQKKYIQLLSDTITQCVVATNQTYVDSLKDKDAFNADAQKEAFTKTYNAVMNILSQDAKVYLTETFGDLELYITQQIEATVNTAKSE
jgi:hypothetical protein